MSDKKKTEKDIEASLNSANIPTMLGIEQKKRASTGSEPIPKMQLDGKETSGKKPEDSNKK